MASGSNTGGERVNTGSEPGREKCRDKGMLPQQSWAWREGDRGYYFCECEAGQQREAKVKAEENRERERVTTGSEPRTWSYVESQIKGIVQDTVYRHGHSDHEAIASEAAARIVDEVVERGRMSTREGVTTGSEPRRA